MNFGSCPEHILNIAYIANVPTSQQYITFGDATKFLTTPVLSLSLTRRTKVRVQVANMSCIGNKSAPIQWHSAGSLGWPFQILNINIFFK